MANANHPDLPEVRPRAGNPTVVDTGTIQSDTADPGRLVHPTRVTRSTIALEFEERYHSGPLPAPDTLRELEQIFPGAAKIIFSEFQAQGKHRRELEKQIVGADIRLASTGQWIGGAIGMTGILGSIVVTAMGHGGWGSLIAGSTLIGLVSVFVIGKTKQSKERADPELKARLEDGEDLESIEGDDPKVG